MTKPIEMWFISCGTCRQTTRVTEDEMRALASNRCPKCGSANTIIDRE